MREILTLSSGQAGVNLGSTFFEYISKEHDIDPNGSCSNQIDQRLARSDVYHDEAQEGKYVPRAIFADLDSSIYEIKQIDAVDNIRSSSFAQLYNANNFITNNQSSGNNWAVGHYTRGAEMIDEVIDCINKEVEKCDSFQGFQLLHSISGGCGSGLGSLIALKMREYYVNRMFTSYTIFPTQNQDIVVSSINATLSVNYLVEYIDYCMVLDNQALSDLSFRNYNTYSTHKDLNLLVSQSMSDITSSSRFPGYMHCDLRKRAVNLIPFPRLHFFSIASVPITYSRRPPTVQQMTQQLFEQKSQMCSLNYTDTRYFSNQLIFRGPLSSAEVEQEAVNYLQKNEGEFVEWISNNITLTMCKQSRKEVPVSATNISNTYAISQVFKSLSEEFTKMFRRKAYFHWYGAEGMDEMEFVEAESNMNDLCSEYYQGNTADYEDDEFE